jgi:hypothetical protein
MAAEGVSAMRPSLGKAVFVVLLMASQLVVSSQPAYAVSCDPGKHIFIRTKNAATHWGIRGDASSPMHTLDPCSGPASFVTVHYNKCSSICGTWVEIGLVQQPDDIYLFTEQGYNYQVINNDQFAFGSFGLLTGFRIKVTQAGDVLFEYDVGSGLHYTSQSYHINWAPGYDYGESEKIGTGTQMSSSHRNLKYLSQNWNESAWLGMKCDTDEAPGWSWHPIPNVDGNDYDVVNQAGSGPCDAV